MPKLFSIEGNIGAGKTTIIEQLQKSLANEPSIIFIREPVDIWDTIQDENGETILAKFYKDPVKFAFAFQVMAYSTRLSLLRKTIKENPDCSAIICERSLDADKNIFAKMLFDDKLIDDVSYQIYKRFYEEFKDEYKLSGIVYIDADPDVCHRRIERRKREGETGIEIDYLQKCKTYHDNWINKNNDIANLTIKTNDDVEYDVENPQDKGVKWLKQIRAFVSNEIENSSLNSRKFKLL